MILEEKIAKLEIELQRYKRKASNRRVVIKHAIRSAKTWQEAAGKSMALLGEMRGQYAQRSQLTYWIAKQRALELGLVTIDETRHIAGMLKIRAWLDEKEAEFKIERGIAG